MTAPLAAVVPVVSHSAALVKGGPFQGSAPFRSSSGRGSDGRWTVADDLPPIRDRMQRLGLLNLPEGAPPDEWLAPVQRWAASLDGSHARRAAERERVQSILEEIGVNAPGRVVKGALEDVTDGNAPDSVASDPTFGDRIVDIVRDGDELRWLTAEDGSVEVEEEVEGRPPWRQGALPWKAVPDADRVVQHLDAGAEAPFQDIAAFIRGRVVLPDPQVPWSCLLAAWTLGTYLLPEFAYFPVILLQGPPERGKTRLGKAILWPSYRGYFTASPTAATVFRDRAFHRCTLMLDVEDVEEVLDHSDLGDLILQGFERGGVVRRCTHPDAEPRDQIETFAAYGATVLTSNEPIRADRPLASRCIPVRLPEARDAEVPDAATPEDAADLRAQATAWAASFRAWGDSLPEADLDLAGRMADLSRPLVRVVRGTAPEAAEGVVRLLHRLDRERRQETAESWEARVALALWDAFQAGEVQNGRVYVEDVQQYANDGRPEEEHLTAQQVGTARKKLGLRKGRGGSRAKTYIRWPGEDEAEQLRNRYTPSPPPSAEDGEKGSGSSASSETRESTGVERAEPSDGGVQGVQRGVQREDPGDVGMTEDLEDPEHLEGGDSEGGSEEEDLDPPLPF